MADLTGSLPKNDNEAQQALQDLVSSPGWRLFCEYARGQHSPARTIADLHRAASETTDMHALGALTAARISLVTAVDQLLMWPEAILDQHRSAYERRRT